MREIPIRDFQAERRLVHDLPAHPHAEFQDGLEFIGRVVPPVVVAECVRWQVIVGGVSTASAMRKDMVCLPHSVNAATADVATSRSLSEHFFALGRRERLAKRNRCTNLFLPSPTCQPQLMEKFSKCLGRRCDDLSWHIFPVVGAGLL